MKLWILSFYLIFFNCLFAQDEKVWMNANKGQWEDQILYRVDIFGGKMYLEKDGFTYYFYENPRSHSEENHDHSENEIKTVLKTHAVKTKFIGSDWQGDKVESDQSGFYSNYFIDNDKSKWKSEVYSYANVVYTDFYPNIDLEVDGANEGLKYSFHLPPNSDPSIIQMSIDGADKVFIDAEGNLHLTTSLGEVIEQKPRAWNITKSGNQNVPVKFVLKKSILSYEFPEGFDASLPLVIDPSLIFSTFTGSTSDNWGMTATPGPNGEMYAGGISFGIGYPVTAGAFDLSYNGGTPNNTIPGFDVAISKFNETGNLLLFSTYLGGSSSNELPESLITSTNGDLYILGITGSTNFPMSENPYDNSFGGGAQFVASGLLFPGSDIFVAKLNAAGTSLMASTYLGGSSNDGANISTLSYNYGDQFRGEIILDGLENVFVASHSQSSNFPVSNGSTLQGTQDAVVFQLNSELSTLVWSGFYGGSANESGNSLAMNNLGELFVAGGTSSSDFVLVGNDPVYGGDRDGYLMKLNANDGTVLSGTYMGDNEYDQTYFVQLDVDNFVYVYGQSETSWAITPGCYSNPNSGQFLRKYSNDLTTIEWTTMFGAGSGRPEISPTAFLISDCYDIFVSGWGGTINSSGQASGSSSNNFPISSDAFQSTTNGSNFYLGILSLDAASLVYGTYMGGTTSSANHVDGGTSRFDKSGAVYHAVCASCGNSNGFTTTPGAWSNVNNSLNNNGQIRCNLAAFKFQLGLPYSLSANSTICNGEPVQLNASGGINYSWSPAGSLSNPNIPNPIATPTETTVYYVEMDFNEGCAIIDSVVVEVIGVPSIGLDAQTEICYSDTTTLSASGDGLTYLWTPNQTIDNPSSPIVNVWPTSSQYYYVTAENECFSNIDSIFVTVNPLPAIIATEDTVICVGDVALIYANGGVTYSWVPDPVLTVINGNQAEVALVEPGYFYAVGFDANGCENRDSVYIDFYDIQELIISPDTSVCLTESAQLSVSGATSYSWSPSQSLTNPNSANPIATPLVPTNYVVNAIYADGCVTQGEVFVDLLYLPVPNSMDTVYACFGQSEQITASGTDVDSYSWSPPTFLDVTVGPTVNTTLTQDFTYTVTYTNICGSVTEDIHVVSITTEIDAFNDTIICPGNTASLYAVGGVSYYWSPPNGLNSTLASFVTATPSTPTMYTVTGIDQYGCMDRDSVFVDLFPLPFIQASPDNYLFEGDVAQLGAETATPGPVQWYPEEYLSCVNCLNPIASPPTDFQYIVSYTDENGCTDSDDVWIYFKPLIWVPNTFTPDGNGTNEVFKVEGGNVRDLQLIIFNRWGEVVKTLNHISEFWDGTYEGNKCQDGTYTWKLTYNDLRGNFHETTGHVNLIR